FDRERGPVGRCVRIALLDARHRRLAVVGCKPRKPCLGHAKRCEQRGEKPPDCARSTHDRDGIRTNLGPSMAYFHIVFGQTIVRAATHGTSMTDKNTIREDSDGVLDFVGQVSEQLRSRRAFMGDAAKVGVGAAALGTVGTGTVAANEGDSSDGNGGSDGSDLDILNYALTLEHLEAAYYDEFLNEYSEHEVERSAVAKYFARPTLQYSTYQQIEDVRDHEQAHVDKLSATIKKLGGTPVEAANYKFPYSSIEEFVAVGDRLEHVGGSAYAGAAPLLSNPDLIPPALSIHSVEANHATYFQLLHLQRP